ncbi:MAG: hypothetical protein JXD19_10530 [Deltaproteobacteria bacterium]|nr:hypothetical protein [Deltaproteobacteria bacterium]
MRYDSEITLENAKKISPGPFREEGEWGSVDSGHKQLFVVWEDGSTEELREPLGRHPLWDKAEYLIVRSVGKEEYADMSFCHHVGGYDYVTEHVYRLKK